MIMTKEERIINEAKRYYSGNIKCYDAFLHGIEFAEECQKNIWHNAEDVPEDGSDVLLMDSVRRVIALNIAKLCYYEAYGLIGWPAYVANYDVKRWAYISDLLPKGCEK